jgi:hypothetical protein
MTLLNFFGFDNQSLHPTMANVSAGTTTYPVGRFGNGFCRRQRQLTSASGYVAWPFVDFLSRSTGQLAMGGAVKTENIGGAARIGFSTFNDTTWDSTSVSVSLTNAVFPQWVLYVGTVAVATSIESELGWASWNYVEVVVTFATGVKVYVNERLVINYVGAIGFPLGQMAFGNPYFSGFVEASFDDFYVTDSVGPAPYNDRLGDTHCINVIPANNGALSQWVNSAGTSVNNYSYVDEIPPNVADYVTSATIGDKDLYQVSVLPAGYDMLATQNIVYALNDGSGLPPALQTTTRGILGADRDDASYVPPSSVAGHASDIYTVDADGNALTKAGIEGSQIGVKVAP